MNKQRKELNKQFTFFVSDEAYQRVKEHVDENGMTIQGFLSVLLKRELARLAKKEEE